MTLKKIFVTAVIILSSLTFWTCKKGKITCKNDQEFCAIVDKQDFDATGPLIDDFLSGLKKNKPDENLEKLADWLECMSCVNNVKILCNSCIFTNPPQSELRIEFNSNGQMISMTMDIIMDEPLKFRAYHQ